MNKTKVMYVVANYPVLSETYIKNEIEALLKTEKFELKIFCLNGPKDNLRLKGEYEFYQNHQPFTVASTFEEMFAGVEAFKPDFIHSHWLQLSPLVYKLAKKTNTPFTVRSHSFDVLARGGRINFKSFFKNWLKTLPQFQGFHPKHVAKFINSDLCKGVLAFPFAKDILIDAGIKPEKITPTFPVVAVEQFMDKSPNGKSIMNVGACIPKKKMEDFIDLAALNKDKEFYLYAVEYKINQLIDYNKQHGNLVKIVEGIEPELMPAEYKKHQWLVYTASTIVNTVGWPLAIAEAQASGVGVCIQNIRPDLKEYVGEAGYLFNTVEEVSQIIQHDVPNEIRELGFEQAKKSDINANIHKLTDLWVK